MENLIKVMIEDKTKVIPASSKEEYIENIVSTEEIEQKEENTVSISLTKTQ